jgi:hypothetical protein
MRTHIPSSSDSAMHPGSGERHWRATSVLALLLLMHGAARAAEHRIECPLKLEAESIQVVNPPAGWTGFIPSFLWLHSAGPVDGAPPMVAVLKADAYVRRGDKSVSKWDMTGVHGGGKWMACNYGDANEIVLTKSLDETTSECTVTATKNAFGRNDLDIRCKW